MKALYDSEARALSIDLEEPTGQAVHGEEIDGLVVALAADGRVVSIEALDPGAGLDAHLTAAADRFGLDGGALGAAARAALAVPDREVELLVGARTAA